MRGDDWYESDAATALGRLPSYDVSPRRAEQLRSRCLATLTRPAASSPRDLESTVWELLTCGAAGAWCAAYLFEIIRHSAAVYRF
jgi:hypothetical protein